MEFGITAGIATLTLARPPANALDETFLDELTRALDIIDESDVSVMLFRSSSPDIFCAGADLSFLRSALDDGASGQARILDFVKRLQAVLRRIEEHVVPSIAVLAGSAIGGGLELALACDLRVAGENTRLGLPEATLGLIPGAGGTQRLTRVVGRGTASRLMLTAELVRGRQALNLGLVQYVAPRDAVDDVARGLAQDIATLPRQAIGRLKSCLAVAPSSEGFRREVEASAELYQHPDTLVRVRQFIDRKL
jgi:enoyl-CoA hydratase/carnithine racemase